MDGSEARLFWGLAFSEMDRVPWTPDKDNEKYADSWPYRYKARAGKPAPSDCHVGIYGRLANFHYCYVGIKASEQSGSDRKTTPFQFPEISPEWRAQLKDFCEVLGISWSEPDWHLIAIQHS
ncbi:MAG: hypothetical protein P1V97_23895 [Planctomycetota bacterium]|nr:hypothetical protein [Planctomycetota bacterium]